MNSCKNNFTALSSKFVEAKKDTSQAQVDFLHAALTTMGRCVGECLGLVFLNAVTVPICAVCLGVKGSQEVKKEKERVHDLIEANNTYLATITTSLTDLQSVATALETQANNQKIAVDRFGIDINKMEMQLNTANELDFLDPIGNRAIIIGLMDPLNKACEALRKQFDETSYDPQH